MDATLTQTERRADRVRERTSSDVNRRIDQEIERNLRVYSTESRARITERLEQLDREWDVERVLEANAAGIALTGLLLGLRRKGWLLLPLTVAGFLLNHAIDGWCPPIAVFRRLGVRTRKEIERERLGLRMLRGDFQPSRTGETPDLDTVIQLTRMP